MHSKDASFCCCWAPSDALTTTLLRHRSTMEAKAAQCAPNRQPCVHCMALLPPAACLQAAAVAASPCLLRLLSGQSSASLGWLKQPLGRCTAAVDVPTWAEKMVFMVGMYCAEASGEPRRHSTRERWALSRCPAAWGCSRLSRHSALDSAADQQGGWVLVAPRWACCAARRCSCPQTWWARGMRATAGWLLPGVMPGDRYSAWLQVESACYRRTRLSGGGSKDGHSTDMYAAQQGVSVVDGLQQTWSAAQNR